MTNSPNRHIHKEAKLKPHSLILKYYGDDRAAHQHNQRPRVRSEELTPSAKHLIRKARTRLSQHSTVPTGFHLGHEGDLAALVESLEREEGDSLSQQERTLVVDALSQSQLDFDVLTPLVENESINDIIVRGHDDISFQSERRNHQTDIRFPDNASFKSFVENLLQHVGRSCTTATPVVDAALGPRIRICVTHESFSPVGTGPTLTIRIVRHPAVSLKTLSFHGLAPTPILTYLADILGWGQATLLISGEVGTGKTTLARALAHSVPHDEAILVIEDTQELHLARRFVRTLLTREANTEGAGRITPAQAIRTGMRMAMNRIVLGELRDAEAAEAFIDVATSGHPGLTTIHAKSGRHALTRLELFLLRAEGNIGVETVRRQISDAVSCIVHLGLCGNPKKRIVQEVLEVHSSIDGILQVSPIFTFDESSARPTWIRALGLSHFADTLHNLGRPLAQIGSTLTLGESYREVSDA